jgi:hypothetical protein
MRVLAAVAWLLALIGSAAADEPRYAPAAGTKLTYRVVSSSTLPSGEALTFGDIHRLAITASDGRAADGAVTPLAILRGCPDSQTSKDCRQARNFPDIAREGDVIIVPVPDAIGAEIAKVAKAHTREIFEVSQTVPIMGARDIEEVDKPEIGATPLFLINAGMACDETLLDGFFPLGKTEQVAVPCTSTIERAQSRLPMAKDFKNTTGVTYHLNFAGRHHISIPAGEFESATIKFKIDGGDKGPTVDGQIEIIEELGVSARSTTTIQPPNSTSVTKTERVMVKVER